MEHFWRILSLTIGVYTKSNFEMKFFFFHKFTHVSLNIGPILFDPHTPEYPFPLAGHMYVSHAWPNF